MRKPLLFAALAAAALHAGVFDSGRKNVAFTVGAGSGYGSSYTIVGLSANYFALNGLSVGLGYRGWLGGDPSINEIDVPVTYYVPVRRNLRPYLGGFARHTFISGDYDDYETYGGRAGISYVQGNGYFSLGWVQEWYSRDNGDDSSRGYPEITAGMSF